MCDVKCKCVERLGRVVLPEVTLKIAISFSFSFIAMGWMDGLTMVIMDLTSWVTMGVDGFCNDYSD